MKGLTDGFMFTFTFLLYYYHEGTLANEVICRERSISVRRDRMTEIVLLFLYRLVFGLFVLR